MILFFHLSMILVKPPHAFLREIFSQDRLVIEGFPKTKIYIKKNECDLLPDSFWWGRDPKPRADSLEIHESVLCCRLIVTLCSL
jgi:hypothetical protein